MALRKPRSLFVRHVISTHSQMQMRGAWNRGGLERVASRVLHVTHVRRRGGEAFSSLDP
jgi:hypothetical protein